MDPLKYIVPGRKRLPYGMMNFADIRQDNYYYVDKTRFIPMIEEADRFFFFIRPRRFGKSLTLNLLRQYYDVRTRDKFEALFGDLYIGQHPTPSRNSYLVLHLNFSGIGGELNDYRRGLDAALLSRTSARYTPTSFRKTLWKDCARRTEPWSSWTSSVRLVNVPDRICISSSTSTTTSPTPSFPVPKACTAIRMRRMAKAICALFSTR